MALQVANSGVVGKPLWRTSVLVPDWSTFLHLSVAELGDGEWKVTIPHSQAILMGAVLAWEIEFRPNQIRRLKSFSFLVETIGKRSTLWSS